jgi:hypothetical protein
MLSEKVSIWSRDPERKLGEGRLVVGINNLPRFISQLGDSMYDTTIFPANWRLRPAPGQLDGELLAAWNKLQAIQSRLAEAEREAATQP